MKKAIFLKLKIKRDLTKLEIENLVSYFLNYSPILRAHVAQVDVNNSNWSEVIVLKHLTFTALAIAVGFGKQRLIPLKKWRQQAYERKDLDNSFFDWLQYIQESFNLTPFELAQILKDEKALPDRRILAALLLSSSETLDVDTRFYANLILITADFSHTWRDQIEDTIESMVANNWKRTVKSQRFALRNPNLSSVLIMSACNDNSCKGIKKAAKILLAAENAVSVKLGDVISEQLVNLATN